MCDIEAECEGEGTTTTARNKAVGEDVHNVIEQPQQKKKTAVTLCNYHNEFSQNIKPVWTIFLLLCYWFLN